MKCPRDGTVLQRVTLFGVELDKCHCCDGIWCDRGEMERLVAANIEDAEEIIERKYGDPKFVSDEVDGYMRCPRCGGNTRLMRYHYTYVTPVMLDRCEKCFGIWLDDGELNSVIGERKGLEEATTPRRLEEFLKRMGRWFS